MPAQNYERDKTGNRLDLTGGINTMLPADLIKNAYSYLQNVRRNLSGRAVARPALGPTVLPAGTIAPPVSMTRLLDPYLAPTPNSFVYITGAAGRMYVQATQVASGLSNLPLSFVPYRPNTSPQPWCYVADPSLGPVTIAGYPSTIYGNPVAGMLKVRSDGLVRKTGIAEPQDAPVVTLTSGPGPNWVIYRYVYRAEETGAVSNPSPESAAQVIAQSTDTGTMTAIDARVIFNPSQYEIDSGQLRTAPIASGILTDYIIPVNFGLSVPANVKIDGITVSMNWLGENAGTGLLSNVSLFYQGSIIGTTKSPGIQNTAGASDATQGSNTDSWGTTLSSDIINDSSFGFGVQIETVQSGSTNRSFINSFTINVYYTNQNATIVATPSPDPQVTKIDFYRSDPGLDNFTFVGTVPNSTTGLVDTLSDLAVAANPILEFDNYEPFPSIDLPRTGTVTVSANGFLARTGGDLFNVRWLPGTIVLLGPAGGSQVAWTLYNRPSSTTSMRVYQSIIDPTTGLPTFNFPATGTNQTYEISEPTLAAEPSPVIWGPTPQNQNAGSFYFGLDPLNPGDLLWSNGNNFDAAADTNRMFVTSPSESLVNGAITSELSTVFSAERFWLIYPNFSDAIAAVTGTQGQQWTLIQAQATRGLFMRYAISALGSMIAYRAKDCIAVSIGGGPEQSITDDIYNLFPHGGSTPQPVVIGGNTVFPPDDTKPNAQTITLTSSYIFYDYQDTSGNPRTLVYDIIAKGWSVDIYNPPANCHLYAVGSPAQLLVGCVDGTVRLVGGGGETGTAIIATPSENGGDSRALKRIGDMFFKGEIQSGTPVNLQFWISQFTRQISGFSPTSLAGTGVVQYFIVDFTSGFGSDVDDIGVVLSWPLGSTNVLDLWQPDWVSLPETIQDRPSDWTECGVPGNKLIRGMIIELDTFNVAKAIRVERSDSETLITPNQATVTANGQTLMPFTFTPFTAHMLRIVSTDGLPWRMWGPDATWICDPWPDYTPLFSAWTNLGSDGAKYLRSLLIPMDTNGQLASFTVQASDGQAVSFSATTPTAHKTPTAFAFTPPIVVHDVQLQCNSNAGLWTEEVKWFFDPYPELIPAYTPIMELSGPDNKFMQGILIVADSGNLPVQFQILFDGGQIGPTLPARTFNGKQTQVYSFNPPFFAHDVQIRPLQSVRIWMPGMGGDDVSKWDYQPAPDAALTFATEATTLGLLGWNHMYQCNLAYVSATPVTLTMTTDQGPFTLTFPPSTGVGQNQPSKNLLKCPRNKWKVVSFSATSTGPFALWKELCEVWVKSWGSTGEYQKVNPFGGPSTAAAEI